jgi:hypothetical protein
VTPAAAWQHLPALLLLLLQLQERALLWQQQTHVPQQEHQHPWPPQLQAELLLAL